MAMTDEEKKAKAKARADAKAAEKAKADAEAAEKSEAARIAAAQAEIDEKLQADADRISAEQAAEKSTAKVDSAAADVNLARRATKAMFVRSRSDRGRRRAGFAFTREKTRIPLADLSADQLAALVADVELIVETIDEVTAG